jgi:hypothetical protein
VTSSKLFSWLDGTVIAEFLWRFGQLTLRQRELDNEIKSTNIKGEVNAPIIRQDGSHYAMAKEPLSFIAYEIRDQDDSLPAGDTLLSPHPITAEKPLQPVHLIMGIGATKYIACESYKEYVVRVVLDTLYPNQDDTAGEVDSLVRMRRLGVKDVEEMVRASGTGDWYIKQETSTKNITSATRICTIFNYRKGLTRYRQVTKDAVHSLSDFFTSTKELITVLRDVIMGEYRTI